MVTQHVDWFATCSALALLALVGCDSGGLPDMVPIRGEVYYDGEPMKQGTVIYSPRGEGRQALGGIQPDGTFVLTTLKKGDGVKKGEYDMAVYAMKPHPGEPKSRGEVELKLAGRVEEEVYLGGKLLALYP